jgi:queuosine precursor transporter
VTTSYPARSQDPRHPFKYYDLCGMLVIAVLLISNSAAPKLIDLGPFTFSAAALLFPISYILGDIMTEVYGYARARRVTWMAAVCQLLMVLTYQFAIWLPPQAAWPHQEAYALILGSAPRIVACSMLALIAGELSNAFVLAKMKILSSGKHLWMRTIGSTFVGQAVDSIIFYPLAFYGIVPNDVLFTLIWSAWVLKVLYETVMTPVTYWVVNKLKRTEEIDFYDVDTNFTPFSLKVNSDGK